MQFRFGFDSDFSDARKRGFREPVKTELRFPKNGLEVHDHGVLDRENCSHEHLDFCNNCNEFYCLDCTEQHSKLREVFLERFLKSDHCQSMETLRDYLLTDGFIVGVPDIHQPIKLEETAVLKDFDRLTQYLIREEEITS